MLYLLQIKSSSEVYGKVANGALKGIPISGVKSELKFIIVVRDNEETVVSW